MSIHRTSELTNFIRPNGSLEAVPFCLETDNIQAQYIFSDTPVHGTVTRPTGSLAEGACTLAKTWRQFDDQPFKTGVIHLLEPFLKVRPQRRLEFLKCGLDPLFRGTLLCRNVPGVVACGRIFLGNSCCTAKLTRVF